jgi:hypothetical protein
MLFVYLTLARSSASLITVIMQPTASFEERVYSGNNWISVPYAVSYAIFATAAALSWEGCLSTRQKVISVLVIGMNALIGPSKGALFAPVLGLLLYRGFVARKRIGRTVLVLGIFLSAGLPLLFMWRNDISVENLKKTLLEYNHFFYYTARTSTELEPSGEYLKQGLHDLLIAPIPRLLWEDKPREYGLTRRVLDYHMYGKDIPMVRSFTTMGLSEAWLVLGTGGVAISGVWFGLIIYWCGRLMQDRRQYSNVILGIILVTSFYPLLRVGFLDLYIYYILLSLVTVWLFDVILVRRHGQRVGSYITREPLVVG